MCFKKSPSYFLRAQQKEKLGSSGRILKCQGLLYFWLWWCRTGCWVWKSTHVPQYFMARERVNKGGERACVWSSGGCTLKQTDIYPRGLQTGGWDPLGERLQLPSSGVANVEGLPSWSCRDHSDHPRLPCMWPQGSRYSQKALRHHSRQPKSLPNCCSSTRQGHH